MTQPMTYDEMVEVVRELDEALDAAIDDRDWYSEQLDAAQARITELELGKRALEADWQQQDDMIEDLELELKDAYSRIADLDAARDAAIDDRDWHSEQLDERDKRIAELEAALRKEQGDDRDD